MATFRYGTHSRALRSARRSSYVRNREYGDWQVQPLKQQGFGGAVAARLGSSVSYRCSPAAITPQAEFLWAGVPAACAPSLSASQTTAALSSSLRSVEPARFLVRSINRDSIHVCSIRVTLMKASAVRRYVRISCRRSQTFCSEEEAAMRSARRWSARNCGLIPRRSAGFSNRNGVHLDGTHTTKL